MNDMSLSFRVSGSARFVASFVGVGKPSGRSIAEAIATRHGLTMRELVGPSRRRRESWPRQEAYWTIRRDTDLSLPQIGRLFGGRDHTTILDGVRRHEERLRKARVG